MIGANQIRETFFHHFKNLFTDEEFDFSKNLDELMTHYISEEENQVLYTIPTPDEIKTTLFNMQDLKAPSLDGFPALFYKEFWPIVGDTITSAVTAFFTNGRLPKDANESLIVLIPKSPNPISINNFRPISLCNVVYKIISKLIVAKLRPLLHKIISPCQLAFIPGRWIAENQVVVHELLHSFKSRKVKNGFMALKLDLQKAYDRVNWKFIQAVLSNLGFTRTFIGWIMACLSSVSFEVLVNGGKSNHLVPRRGLRQGDSLSPYLFILGQEVLSRMLDRELMEGNINGAKPSIRSPALTHVMYTDDIVLFSKVTTHDARTLSKCLEKYYDRSGQSINRAKSGIFFSKHTLVENRRAIKL